VTFFLRHSVGVKLCDCVEMKLKLSC